MSRLPRTPLMRRNKVARAEHSHLKAAVVSLVVLCLFSVPAQGAYCEASGTDYSYEHISRVQVGDIDNSSAGSSYTDYTHISTMMETGVGYQITVTNAYPYDQYDRCGVWVDWNQDEVFDVVTEAISISPDQTQPGGG
ncbi:MAG: hypothetical protein ACYS4W_08080, partial [Planctomycetota bacterium]